MAKQQSEYFHLRRFISLLTALSFLVMAVSGLILFITPQGRIAYWLDWTIFGLSKEDWGNIHITTSLLFAVAGLWHVWNNWKVLLSYFQDKIKKTLTFNLELGVSIVIIILFSIGGIYDMPPISYIIKLNSFIKDSWVRSPEDEPVINHAELLPLITFLQKVNIDVEPAIAELQQQGIQIGGPDQKLLDIARNNRISPSEIYKRLKQSPVLQKTPSSGGQAPLGPQLHASSTPVSPSMPSVWTAEMVHQEFDGKGIGRKTLAAICQELRLDLTAITAKLAKQGITMAPDDTLKKVSEERGAPPIELLKIILVGERR